MIKNLYCIAGLIIFALSCTNVDNSSFIDFKRSFSQWNLNYSPSTSFITVNDPLLHQKKFIGEEYTNDIKRFLIELNQINKKRISAENKLEYEAIKNFLERNIFINETLNFNDWNVLYLLDNYYRHLLYIGKLVQNNYTVDAPSIELDLLIDEIIFFDNQILFLLNQIKYKYNSEPELLAVSSTIEKMLSYSNYFCNEALNRTEAASLHPQIRALLRTMDKLKVWKETHYHKLEPHQDSFSDISYKKYFHLNSDFKIEFEDILNEAHKMMAEYEKMLFDFSLPLYLDDNDEPVWTDFSDTINVVKTVFNTLENTKYQCSNKDAVIRIIDASLEDLFSDNLYKNKDIIFIPTKEEVDRGYNYYDTSESSRLYINSSRRHSDIYENYYFTLMNLLPGDLFIYSRLINGNDFNHIYLNKNYFYGFKFLLIDYYLNNPIPKSNNLELCGVKNSEYLKIMELLYLKDRLVDCVGTIATINYYLDRKNISEMIQINDRLELIDDRRNSLLMEEIFGYRMDSIIKFTSLNKLQKLIQSENKSGGVELLNILYNNPNLSLVDIEKLFNK